MLATECTLLRPLILVPRAAAVQGAPKKKWRAAPALEGAVEALRGKDDDARLDALMGAAVSGDTFVVAALAQLGLASPPPATSTAAPRSSSPPPTGAPP